MILLMYVHHAKIRVYHVSEQVYTMSPVYTLKEEGKERFHDGEKLLLRFLKSRI
jgi:hypothetical protein